MSRSTGTLALLVAGFAALGEPLPPGPGPARPPAAQPAPTPPQPAAQQPAPTPAPPAATPAQVPAAAPPLPSAPPERSCPARRPLAEKDREVARIAWQYFRKNTQKTGLVNAVDGYPSTTLWDTASSLAGILAARQLDLIPQKEMDDRVSALLGALATQKLYRDELPNKAYNAQTNEMVDYGNHPVPGGIGDSALDLARLSGWLRITGCLYPRHRFAVQKIFSRWSFCRMVRGGELHGAMVAKGRDVSVQEGRTGYEQYAAHALERLGFELSVSSKWHNRWARTVKVENVPLLVDRRSPHETVALNYVTTDAYALDAFEHGIDEELAPLLRNLFEAQRRRWKRTGLPTAATEDHIDRAPWFLYGTLWTADHAWATISDEGGDFAALRWISTKAAFSLATLFPDDPYSGVLVDEVRSAYDPERGWYAGLYENGMGYNRALTSNTNGIILEAMLYKALGPLQSICTACGGGDALPPAFLEEREAKDRCMPRSER